MSILLIQFSINNKILSNKYTIKKELFKKQNIISLLKTISNTNLILSLLDLYNIDLYYNNTLISDTVNVICDMETIVLIEIRENTYLNGSLSQLSGHKGPVLCLDIISDNLNLYNNNINNNNINHNSINNNNNFTVITGGADKTVRIWRNGFLKYTFCLHNNWVQVVKGRIIDDDIISNYNNVSYNSNDYNNNDYNENTPHRPHPPTQAVISNNNINNNNEYN
ncbi:hypothetical protein CDIK_4211, partial [Cucumispora dikerogammari]